MKLETITRPREKQHAQIAADSVLNEWTTPRSLDRYRLFFSWDAPPDPVRERFHPPRYFRIRRDNTDEATRPAKLPAHPPLITWAEIVRPTEFKHRQACGYRIAIMGEEWTEWAEDQPTKCILPPRRSQRYRFRRYKFGPNLEFTTSTSNGDDALRELRLALARHEHYSEDDGGSDLHDVLSEIVAKYGSAAIDAFDGLARSAESSSATSDALRVLGDLNDTASLERRRLLLENCLDSSLPAVRYGALFGLARLGNSASIPRLRLALEHEQIRGLRRDLEKVLHRLESSNHADVRSDR